MPDLPQHDGAATGADDWRAAVLAAFLGWTLDAFDFFLVVFCLTAIAHEFGRADSDLALSLTLTLAFRPVGAFVFGLLADRYGRRWPLMLDLMFYSICEVASGLAPDYRTFMVLRALFGIGMGGEWGLGASLAIEKVPPGSRGFVSGLLQQGYAAGYLLAAVAFFVVFPRFGWRPLCFLGGLPALRALYVRTQISESEVWERTRLPSWVALGREIASHWHLVLHVTLLMTMMGLVSHGTQDMYPTFLERQWGFGPRARAAITAFSMVGAIVGGVSFGALSERVGRRRAIVIALLGALAVVPLWAFATHTVLLVAGGFLVQLLVQGAWGVVPAHLTELSPEGVRGFLPGFAYQCGVLLAGSVAYLEAVLAQRASYAVAMASVAALVFAGAAVVVAVGRERRGVQVGA